MSRFEFSVAANTKWRHCFFRPVSWWRMASWWRCRKAPGRSDMSSSSPICSSVLRWRRQLWGECRETFSVSQCRKACYRCVNTHLQTLTSSEQQHVLNGCYTCRRKQRFVFPRQQYELLWHCLCTFMEGPAPCLASMLATVRLTGSHFGWHLLFESFVAASHSRSTLYHLNIAAHMLTSAHTFLYFYFLRTFPDIIYSPAS